MEAISHLNKGLELLKTLPETPERMQQELELLIPLGQALMVTKGQGAPEVEHVYALARERCQHVEETPQLFPVLGGLCGFYVMRGVLQTAREIGVQLLRLAQGQQNPTRLIDAHQALGSILFHFGELAPAYAHLEQAMALYGSQPPRSIATPGGDPRTVCLSFMAFILWLRGYPDQALESIHKALTLVQELSNPFGLAQALCFAANVYQCRREGQAVQERAEAAITLSTEQEFPLWEAHGTIMLGWALAEQGQGEEWIAPIRQGLSIWQATGAVLVKPRLLCLLAEAYRHVSQLEEGLMVLTEALAAVNKTEERFYEAELYRLKGELLLIESPDNHAEVETCFQKAIAVAQNQQAKSWELRAAMSLARLWQQQNKRIEAYGLLTPVYNWFTEGFDTADLQEAKALLVALR